MAETSSEAIIEIRDLSFKYPLGSEPSLHNISLKIYPGEYVVITGPTGSGKTSLAITLNGIIPNLVEGDLEGAVIVDGMNTAEHQVHELTSSIGMVFQNPEDQLFSLNVTDEVAFGVENMGYLRPEIIERVDGAIEKVGLVSRRSYSIFHLSGGQKQKVAIASNLAIAPKILVLDSPTADLDPISSREVVNTLIDLRKKEPSKTFIVIDSDISDVINLADRIIVMDAGRIVLDTTPLDLLKNHFDLLDSLGIRVPDHIRVMYWLQQHFPEITEFPLEQERVHAILDELTNSGRLVFSEAAKNKPHPNGKVEDVVKFKNVSFKYDHGPVILDNADLEIKNGEWLAIIGENGTGKSTVMKLVCGLIKPDQGVVETAGVNTSTSKLEDVLPYVGYLFQNPDNQLFMGTVEDEIGFSPRHRNCAPEDVEERINVALDLMDLQAERKNHPFTLSRGQRQRLAVATVLASRPKLLLLDEPTTGQDQVALDNLMHLTGSLIRDHSASVIMITHDMDLVARYATRVLVLDKGKIILDGSPMEIFTNARDTLARMKLIPPCMVELTTGLKGSCACMLSFDSAIKHAVVYPVGGEAQLVESSPTSLT